MHLTIEIPFEYYTDCTFSKNLPVAYYFISFITITEITLENHYLPKKYRLVSEYYLEIETVNSKI